MNSTFCLRRFWQLFKRELALSWIEPTVFVALVLLEYVCRVTFPYQREVTFPLIPLLLLVFVYLPTQICVHTRGKRQFISFETFPASMLEKFVCRLLIYWLLPIAIFICSTIGYFDYSEDVSTYMEHVYECWGVLVYAIVIVWSLLSLLSSVLFKRLKVFFSVLVALALFVVGFLTSFIANLMFLVPMLEYLPYWNPIVSHMVVCMLPVVLVPMAIFIPLTYRLFKRQTLTGINFRKSGK